MHALVIYLYQIILKPSGLKQQTFIIINIM